MAKHSVETKQKIGLGVKKTAQEKRQKADPVFMAKQAMANAFRDVSGKEPVVRDSGGIEKIVRRREAQASAIEESKKTTDR